MKSQASASEEKGLNQGSGSSDNRRNKKIISGVLLSSLIVICTTYILRPYLREKITQKVSRLLNREVDIGEIKLCPSGILLKRVSVRGGGFSFFIPKVVLQTGFSPPGQITVERVLLSNPEISIEGRKGAFSQIKGLLSSEKTGLLSRPELPEIIIRNGRFPLPGHSVEIIYLRFKSYSSHTGFSVDVFSNLEFTGFLPRGMPVSLIGKFSLLGRTKGKQPDLFLSSRLALDKLSIGRFGLSDVTADGKFFEGKVMLNELRAWSCGGYVQASAQIEASHSSLKWKLSGIDLNELSKELGTGNDEIKGQLDLTVDLSGKANDIGSWNGEASLSIRDGHLWKIPVLYGLSTILMRPVSRGGVFRQGAAKFKIADGLISTTDLKLIGDDMGIAADGKLGFDGTLDFNLTTVFTEDFMSETPDVVEMIPVLSKILDFFIVKHHISGNIKNPSYKLIPLPVITRIPDYLKKILGILSPKSYRQLP